MNQAWVIRYKARWPSLLHCGTMLEPRRAAPAWPCFPRWAHLWIHLLSPCRHLYPGSQLGLECHWLMRATGCDVPRHLEADPLSTGVSKAKNAVRDSFGPDTTESAPQKQKHVLKASGSQAGERWCAGWQGCCNLLRNLPLALGPIKEEPRLVVGTAASPPRSGLLQGT